MKKVYTIGRDLQNDIVLNDQSDVISRLHATIRFDGTKMFLIDQSQNGTYVNGMRMSSNEEVPISRKDTVSFANVANLDWSLLPDPGKAKTKKTLLFAAIILAIALILWVVFSFVKPDKQQTTIQPTTNEEVISPSIDEGKDDGSQAVEDTAPVSKPTSPKVGRKNEAPSKVETEEPEPEPQPEPEPEPQPVY